MIKNYFAYRDLVQHSNFKEELKEIFLSCVVCRCQKPFEKVFHAWITPKKCYKKILDKKVYSGLSGEWSLLIHILGDNCEKKRK